MFFDGFEKTARSKNPYKEMDIKGLDPTRDDQAWTAKIDGAHTLIDFNKGKVPELFSHRISKRTGELIPYNEKLPHIGHKSRIDARVRGETFATYPNGMAVHPDVVTAMLNRGVEKSLELQKELKLKTHVALIDVDSYRGRDMRKAPFQEKRAILEEIVKTHPDFTLPSIAYTPHEKKRLLAHVVAGTHPQTKEGLIVHDLSKPGAPFAKAKIIQDHDVYVREIFPEQGSRGKMAGGFTYSWTPSGEIKGRVGTGFDHAEKKDMLENPDDYIGRVARVKALDVSKNRVLVKTRFKMWHVEKNIEKSAAWAKQTVIIDKSVSKDREDAKKKAKRFADRLYTSRETGSSYRFRQLHPSKFKKGSFRTSKPKHGVSIVYGELKEKK
jgi:hypothetical protein